MGLIQSRTLRNAICSVPGMKFFGAESTKIMGCTRIINNLSEDTVMVFSHSAGDGRKG